MIYDLCCAMRGRLTVCCEHRQEFCHNSNGSLGCIWERFVRKDSTLLSPVEEQIRYWLHRKKLTKDWCLSLNWGRRSHGRRPYDLWLASNMYQRYSCLVMIKGNQRINVSQHSQLRVTAGCQVNKIKNTCVVSFSLYTNYCRLISLWKNILKM